MSKQDSSKSYMELKNVGQTFFTWKRQKYSVESAPPDAFDGWIRQYVEEIINVDTFLWDIFDRWQIVNAVLKGGILAIKQQPDGSHLEVKSSVPKVDKVALEAEVSK